MTTGNRIRVALVGMWMASLGLELVRVERGGGE